MEKKFSLEKASNPEKNYKTQILSVINDIERRVRIVNPEGNTELYKKLHEKKLVDARKEVREFEPVRTDICDTFAVPEDAEHVFMFDAHRGSAESSVKQRAIRCFCVIFDTLKHEGFYAEGRTIHNFLLNKIVELIQSENQGLSEDDVYSGMDNSTPRFVFVKGFMSVDGFRELPEKYRQEQEHPLVDLENQPIQTAQDWFVSGSSLEDVKKIKGESRLVS